VIDLPRPMTSPPSNVAAIGLGGDLGALQNAASLAWLLLGAEAVIGEIPENKGDTSASGTSQARGM